MINYLLLRDNKQSGPYTFDELKEKGLKAYDLVWVEGRSAAWRYPCEIEELSAFAPQVEEQPFDRFYKKPTQNQNYQNNNTPAPPAAVRTSSNAPVAATILTGDGSSATPGRRIIYVTLPAGKTTPAPAAAPAARVEREMPSPAKDETAYERYLPGHTAPAPVGNFEDIPAQSNEGWRSDVEITPRTTKKKSSFRLGQTLLVGITVMALLAAGIFIGLSLNKDSPGFLKHLSLNNGKDKPAVTSPPVSHTTQPLAVNSLPPAPSQQDISPVKDSVAVSTSGKTEQAAASVPPVIAARSTFVQKVRPSSAQKSQTAVTTPKDSSLQALPAAHREALHRSDLTTDRIDKDAIRNNLSNLVSIGASGYTVGTFGGISDLQLTVSNRSTYSLDLVVVEVQYIQANKKVFKTENLYFRGIAPGSALMQVAPKSSRGIKVQYKITLVNSKELGLSYSTL